MNSKSVNRIYSSYAGVYDFVFGRFFRPRVRELVRQLPIRPGDTVLELGFGTGISLDYYPPGTIIYAVDICRSMMAQAAERIAASPHLTVHLVESNALNLAFPDNTFDHVMGAHMISVVEDPYQVISEMLRTCKPGGQLALANHFQSENRLVGVVEKMLNPICKQIGWRTDLKVKDLVDNTEMEILRNYKLKTIDLWRLVFFQKPGGNGNGNVRSELVGFQPSSMPTSASELAPSH